MVHGSGELLDVCEALSCSIQQHSCANGAVMCFFICSWHVSALHLELAKARHEVQLPDVCIGILQALQ